MVSCDLIGLAVLTTKFHPNRISFATLLGFNHLNQFWPIKWFFEKTQKWIGKNHSNFFTKLIGIFVIDVICVSRSSEVQVVISKLKYHHILGFEKLQKKREKNRTTTLSLQVLSGVILTTAVSPIWVSALLSTSPLAWPETTSILNSQFNSNLSWKNLK